MKKSGDLVSVIVPIYGVEDYVGDAIRSVLAQSWPNFEVIAVDDASPDGSFAIVESFDDARIRPVRLKRNRGLAGARNAGIEAARGDFIALLDGDDIMHPTRLQRQLDFMRRHPDIALSGGWCRTFGPATDSPRQFFAPLPIDPRAVNASLVFANLFCASSLMIRRAAVPAEGFRTRYAEDYDFLVRVAARHRLALVREIYVDYRLRPGSIMRTSALESKQRDVWESQLPLFDALKVVPSEQERDLHLSARFNGRFDCERLVALGRWYERLIRANRRARVYGEEEFSLAASHMWFEQLYRATGCGLDALRLYFGSPLGLAHPQPFVRRAKFVIKALMRRELARPQP